MHGSVSSGLQPTTPPSPAPSGPKPRLSRSARRGVWLLFLGVACCFLYFPYGLLPGLFLIMAGGVAFFTERK